MSTAQPQRKFHIWFGDSRTTVTVDQLLFELMAFKLEVLPDDEQAHSAVRAWLEDTLVSNLGERSGRKNASQWARIYMIRQITDKRLAEKHRRWWLGE